MDDTLTLDELLELAKRHIGRSLALIFVSGVLAVMVAFTLTPRYKTKALLNINSGYFRNPLVSDLIPEVSDPAELAAQRQSLLKLALSDDFVDSLGEKYGIYSSAPDTVSRAKERELLSKKIELFSPSASNFQLGVIGTDPNTLHQMTLEIVDRITYTLVDERLKLLVGARDAIEGQVKGLGKSLRASPSALGGKGGAGRVDALQAELAKLNASIDSLKTKFTESHPDLAALREKASVVKRELKATEPPRPKPQTPAKEPSEFDKYFLTASAQGPQDIFNDLLRKLTNLNIILKMENDPKNVSYLNVIEAPSVPRLPTFPSKRGFLLIGLGAGAALALLVATAREVQRGAQVTPERASITFGAPLLGELPPLESGERLLLLESNVGRAPALPPGMNV